MKILFTKLGFSPRKAIFNDSIAEEMKEPLHVVGLEPKWQNLNQKFYNDNKLVHKLVEGKYHINFKVTGFDRDPLTSLIVEAKKQIYVDKKEANNIFNKTSENYNRYSYSLLKSDEFINTLEGKEIKFSTDE